MGYSYSTAMPGEDGYLCSVWDSVGLASGQLCAKHLRCSGHQLKWRRGGERKVGEGGEEGRGGRGEEGRGGRGEEGRGGGGEEGTGGRRGR